MNIPYGETWVQEKATTGESMPYKFTSKELDPETGLYYFGARYYEPRISRWTTVDQIFYKYIPNEIDDFDVSHDYYYQNSHDSSDKLRGRGGVYNPINLHQYCYAENNPLMFLDPDGNENILLVKAKNSSNGRFESEALSYKNNTFSGFRFGLFRIWAAIKTFFGGHVSRGDAEFFLGKADKIFSDFSSLSDNPKEYGTVSTGNMYDYSLSDWKPSGAISAYRLTDKSVGKGKVPQDSRYNKGINPSKPAGRNYVEGAHLHKAYDMGGGTWGGSTGCLIQKGFDNPGGLGHYLGGSRTRQSGKVLIYR